MKAQFGLKISIGKTALGAVVICATMAISPSTAFGENLIANGTFETGTLESWTRNTSTGSKGKQGEINVYSNNKYWVDSSLGNVLVMQSYNYTSGGNATSYGNSTDSYVVQSFEVAETGEYTISLGYAGRGGSNGGASANWNNATSYVRLYRGTDIDSTLVFEGSFTPTSNTALSEYRGLVQITETGTYTLQLLRPQPTGSNEDKTVVIDNVSFDINHIVNGTFEAGNLWPWTRNNTKGEANKQGDVVVQSLTNSASTIANSSLSGQGGTNALYMASYNYNNATHKNSTDTYVVQTFEVGEAGDYVISFDYAGRNNNGYWENATNYVCIYTGTDITATPIFSGEFSATSRTQFSTFIARVRITVPGTYTLQLLRPQPTGYEDKGVVIDNVSFVKRPDNLIVNGTFEAGNLSCWTRNDTVGAAGKQGDVDVKSLAMSSTFVNSTLGGQGGDYALYMASYNYSRTDYLNSTDTYVVQSFNVDKPGVYAVSLDYAGRNHSDSYWVNATNYVCIYKGTNLDTTPVFKGGFSATSKTQFSTYSGRVSIKDSGTYTLQLLRPQPTEYEDKGVVIDNVSLVWQRSIPGLIIFIQ